MIPFRSIQGGRQRVHSAGVTGLIRGKFWDCPHLADFLEQSFTLLQQQDDKENGAILLTEPVVAEILDHMRTALTAQFGRRVRTGDDWVRVLTDVDPGRARMVFGLCMRFPKRRELLTAIVSPEFSWLREYVAATHSAFLSFLILKQGKVKEREARDLVSYINILACMVVSPRHPDAVLDDAHRLGNFVDILLNDEEVVDDAPTYVPPPGQAATTTYVRKRVPPVPLHHPPPQLRLVEE